MPAAPTLSLVRRWWVVLLLVVACTLTVAIFAAGILCKSYWGYVLSPPGVDPRVLGATKLHWHVTKYFYKPTDMLDVANPPPFFAQNYFQFNAFEEFARARNKDGAWRLVPPALDANAWRQDWIARRVIGESEFHEGGSPPL